MSTPRFIADTHMGHRNIWKYRPVFKSTLHNDLYFMRVLEETSTKRDVTYYLGDILFDEKYLDFIDSLPGTKILVPGNHCTEYIPMHKLCKVFDEVHSLLKYKEFWLSHAPIHIDELRGKKNIHGHVHASSVQDPNYLNVSVDSSFMSYYPRTLHEVREAFVEVNKTQNIFQGIPNEDAISVMMSNRTRNSAYIYALDESNRILGQESE